MTKKMFDGIVVISFLMAVAINGVGKSWARKELAQNRTDISGKIAGTIQLAA